MTQQNTPTAQQQRQANAKYKVGLATQLKEIKADLAEVKRTVQALAQGKAQQYQSRERDR